MSIQVVEVDECDLPLEWAQLPPGPELAIRLALVDWPDLSDWELVAAMEAARRQATWAQALQLEGIAELARRRRVSRLRPSFRDNIRKDWVQFPVCSSPNRSQVLPLKRMNCIWSTGT